MNSSYTLYRIMFIDNNLKIIIVKNNHNLKRDLSKLEILVVIFIAWFCLYHTKVIDCNQHWNACCYNKRVRRLFNYLIAILSHYYFIDCLNCGVGEDWNFIFQEISLEFWSLCLHFYFDIQTEKWPLSNCHFSEFDN